ncbi:MAG: type II toxin-antitoxin system HipA family toxin [Proteobacteria bacterium]|nr:type II toxin-antitoxin system HipA family toxin [Pseudomonadota bacterium]MBU1641515.1 type II toxin-antitoxin system HipA family toxin [Pseudomonadota bacterium]
MSERIEKIRVSVPAGECGTLEKTHRFSYAYDHAARRDHQISLTMPVRLPSYSRGAIHPIFEQNLPEGFIRERIIERLRKHIRIDEMLFLALQRDYGIGRLKYHSNRFQDNEAGREDLAEILHWQGPESLFEELVDKYLLQTSISGVQPKVLVGDTRATFHTPGLIIKSGLAEYPGLAVNEYFCMVAAKGCGLNVPEFHLSDDHSLFIMHRFDLDDDGERLGMEDFSVLLGERADDKYTGSYESLADVIKMYCASPRRDLESFFRLLVLSVAVGNGDAHKKNFSVIYDDITRPETIRLSPAYDIVSTLPYIEKDTPALKMNGQKKSFPQKAELIRFGKRIGIKQPSTIIEQVVDTVNDTLTQHKYLFDAYPIIYRAIEKATSNCAH